MGLVRRVLLGGCLGLVAMPRRGSAAEAEPWEAFKRRFLLPEGRVVDSGNHGVSHTEGQGWGLLFAATFDDRPAFDAMMRWTTATLRRPDGLHRWRFVPGEGATDGNNATDGDLFIAMALLRAGTRWHRPALTRQAIDIGRAVLSALVVDVHGALLLAPGVDGFRRPEGLVINPSYYAFPALDALARAVPDPRWARLRQDGLAALAAARFGEWALPPDWVLAGHDGSWRPAPGFAPRYGYDAIRVALYLAWAGVDSPVTGAVQRWWRHASPAPAWVDVTDGTTADYAAGPGMVAATELALGETPNIPMLSDDMDYYTAALCLLARVAALDLIADRTAAGPH